MAIQANLNFKGIPLSGAYIRLNHLGGGKRNGWSGNFHVFPTAAAAQAPSPDPLFVFGASATYYVEDQGRTPDEAAAIGTRTPAEPFAALYAQAKLQLAREDGFAATELADV